MTDMKLTDMKMQDMKLTYTGFHAWTFRWSVIFMSVIFSAAVGKRSNRTDKRTSYRIE